MAGGSSQPMPACSASRFRAFPCASRRPHPEEPRSSRGVSKDGNESVRCVHPSRRLLRKLLRMRSVRVSLMVGDGARAPPHHEVHVDASEMRANSVPPAHPVQQVPPQPLETSPPEKFVLQPMRPAI